MPVVTKDLVKKAGTTKHSRTDSFLEMPAAQAVDGDWRKSCVFCTWSCIKVIENLIY